MPDKTRIATSSTVSSLVTSSGRPPGASQLAADSREAGRLSVRQHVKADDDNRNDDAGDQPIFKQLKYISLFLEVRLQPKRKVDSARTESRHCAP